MTLQPTYQNRNVTLYLGDCLSILSSLPDNSVSAVVTDPPYNVGFDYGDDFNDRRDDYKKWCESWFRECVRVAADSVLFTCGIVNLGMWYSIAEPNWVLCWHKPACMGRSPVGFNNWEPILMFGKSRRQGCDVVRAMINPDPSLEGHPCPKPLDWARGLVDLFSPPGGTVLDPFMGSGTTGVACVREGRDFIGIELNPDYFAIAERRIREAEAHRDGTAGELFAKASLFDSTDDERVS